MGGACLQAGDRRSAARRCGQYPGPPPSEEGRYHAKSLQARFSLISLGLYYPLFPTPAGLNPAVKLKAAPPQRQRQNGYLMTNLPQGLPPVDSRFFPGSFGPRERERRQLRRSATAIAFVLLGYLALSFLLPLLFYWVASWFLPGPGVAGGLVWAVNLMNELIYLVTYVCALALPFWLYTRWVGIPRRKALPFRPVPVGLMLPAVLLGLGATSLGNFISAGLGSVFALAGFVPVVAQPGLTGSPAADLVVLISATLAAATVEEFAFRGVLLQSLRRYGDGFAVLASAVVFALCHASFLQLGPALLSGLVMGYFAVVTGSLWVGFVTHLVYNSVAMAAGELIPQLPVHLQNTANLAVSAAMLVVGLAAAVYLALRYEKAFSLKAAATLLGARAKWLAVFSSVPFTSTVLVLLLLVARSFVPIT